MRNWGIEKLRNWEIEKLINWDFLKIKAWDRQNQWTQIWKIEKLRSWEVEILRNSLAISSEMITNFNFAGICVQAKWPPDNSWHKSKQIILGLTLPATVSRLSGRTTAHLTEIANFKRNNYKFQLCRTNTSFLGYFCYWIPIIRLRLLAAGVEDHLEGKNLE